MTTSKNPYTYLPACKCDRCGCHADTSSVDESYSSLASKVFAPFANGIKPSGPPAYEAVKNWNYHDGVEVPVDEKYSPRHAKKTPLVGKLRDLLAAWKAEHPVELPPVEETLALDEMQVTVPLEDGTQVEVDVDCDGLWIMVEDSADEPWYRFSLENGLKLMATIASMYTPEAVAAALAEQAGQEPPAVEIPTLSKQYVERTGIASDLGPEYLSGRVRGLADRLLWNKAAADAPVSHYLGALSFCSGVERDLESGTYELIVVMTATYAPVSSVPGVDE